MRLTRREAADRLGIGTRGVTNLARKGVLPAERDEKGHRSYKSSDVDKTKQRLGNKRKNR